MTKPFLKWAGGKRRLANTILSYFPEKFENYFEPFLGGGAVFFEFKNCSKCHSSWLSDSNPEVINCFKQIKTNVNEVIHWLAKYSSDCTATAFYKIRKKKFTDDAKGAARTIYLNKLCYNGLYRLNKSGKFNAPYGHYLKPSIFSIENLVSASMALENTELITVDFDMCIKIARPGDLIYADPPYIPVKANSFTEYTKSGFSYEDHLRLRDCLTNAHKRGIWFILTNSFCEESIKLYQNFKIHGVQKCANSINCNGEDRGKVKELIITNVR